jgi:hypothetical protein
VGSTVKTRDLVKLNNNSIPATPLLIFKTVHVLFARLLGTYPNAQTLSEAVAEWDHEKQDTSGLAVYGGTYEFFSSTASCESCCGG